MDPEATTLARANQLRIARHDEIIRYCAAVGFLLAAICVGLHMGGALRTREVIYAGALYNLVAAVGNRTSVDSVPFNYTRILDRAAMETLVLEVLPGVKQGWIMPVDKAGIGLMIAAGVFFVLSIVFSLVTNPGKSYETSYMARADRFVWGFCLGPIVGVVICCVMYGHEGRARSFILMGSYLAILPFVISTCLALGVVFGHAWPEKRDPGRDGDARLAYAGLWVCYVAMVGAVIAALLFALLLLGVVDTPADRTAFALFELRDVIGPQTNFESKPFTTGSILSQQILYTLRDSVLPHVVGVKSYVAGSKPSVAHSVLFHLGHVLGWLCPGIAYIGAIVTSKGRLDPYRRQLAGILFGAIGGVSVALVIVLVSEGDTTFNRYLTSYNVSSTYSGFLFTLFPALFALLGAAFPERRGEDKMPLVDEETRPCQPMVRLTRHLSRAFPERRKRPS